MTQGGYFDNQRERKGGGGGGGGGGGWGGYSLSPNLMLGSHNPPVVTRRLFLKSD